MTTNLLDLVSKFREANDRESEMGFFRTHVPWVAPEAYLNIIFKPVPRDVLTDATNRLRIPRILADFLARQNGAILFSGALNIYGVHSPGQLLNRLDPFSLPPFNIENENTRWPPHDPGRLLAIGGYGFDGSRACIDRHNLSVHLFQRGETSLQETPSLSWKDLDEWILSEISRLSILFDTNGRRMVTESETVPDFRVRKPS